MALHASCLCRRDMGTMASLRRQPTRPKAASVPQQVRDRRERCRSAFCRSTAPMPRHGPSLRAAVTAPRIPATIRAKPNPIVCGIHDDGRPTLTRQLPRPMGFIHRHPSTAGSFKHWPVRVEPIQVCPGSCCIPTPTHGVEPSFIYLYSSFFAPTAHCPQRPCLACNALGCGGFPYLSHSLLTRRVHPRSAHFHLAVRPFGLPAGSKTEASFEALVSPEHHALALTGSRLASWH
ncbi:hypothetical protein BOMU111920_18870 [Bordetella muralis]